MGFPSHCSFWGLVGFVMLVLACLNYRGAHWLLCHSWSSLKFRHANVFGRVEVNDHAYNDGTGRQ